MSYVPLRKNGDEETAQMPAVSDILLASCDTRDEDGTRLNAILAAAMQPGKSREISLSTLRFFPSRFFFFKEFSSSPPLFLERNN